MIPLALLLPLLAADPLASPGAAPGPAPQDDELGVPGPVRAAQWFGWIGDGPTLESLRGQGVLVHFFTTERMEGSGLLRLCKFRYELEDEGLVVLALTPDPPEKVAKLLEEYPVTVAVGAGSTVALDWNVRGEKPAAQIALDVHGDVFYRGRGTNAVWEGKLRKAASGAKRLGDRLPLKLIPKGEHVRAANKILGYLEEGELGRAVKELERSFGRASVKQEDAADLRQILVEVEAHVKHLMEQIEVELGRGEVLLARRALEALADELEDHPLGEPAAALLERLDADPQHQRELEAALEWEDLMDRFWRLGYDKNEGRFEKMQEEHSGTRAAEKARWWALNYKESRW